MTPLVDTHAHLYSNQFKNDRNEMIARAKEIASHLFLPNVDSESVESMLELSRLYPELCFPMMGLHPCSVKEDYVEEIARIEKFFRNDSFKWYGVGETGLDYHWDKTFVAEQKICLDIQINWAKESGLPLILHCRESMDDVIEMIQNAQDGRLKGIFHCFNGSIEQGKKIIDANFFLGIGGVVTYKNSGMDMTLKSLPMERMVLETDAPYLAPVPHRGKRNESSYLPLIANKLAEIFEVMPEKIAAATSENALKLFPAGVNG